MKIDVNALGLEELSIKESQTANGGFAITGTAIALGALFVGSVGLGFAIGSRIWY